MLFTSTTAPFRQTPSLQFKEKGDTDGFPGVCESAHIYTTHEAPGSTWPIYRAMIPSIVVASLNRGPSSVTSQAVWRVAYPVINTPPMIGISFNNLTEAAQATVEGLGFVPDAHGRFKYFRGTTKPSEILTLYNLGARVNTFVPVGVADLEGMEAYVISSRILAAIKAAIPTDYTMQIPISQDGSTFVSNSQEIGGAFRLPAMEDLVMIGAPMAYDLKDDQRLSTLKAAKNFKKTYPSAKKGIFMPYFQGLVLPDKAFVPSFLIDNFSSLFGTDSDEVKQTSQTLWSGWSTLASTQVGLQLQHQAYCLKISLIIGCKIISFIPGGVYQGSILINGPEDLKFHKRGKEYTPIEIDALIKELKEYDSQEELLTELTVIINAIPLLSEDSSIEGNTLSIKPASIKSARTIHNILRGLKFVEEDKVKIRAILKKINFPTKFLDPRNPEDLIKVFRIAGSKEFLADTEPMSVLDDAIFSRDPINSAFAAFGATAPSFYDDQGTAIPILRRTGETKDQYGSYELSKRKTPQGDLMLPKGLIPVFIKSSQQASADFKEMLRSNAIRVRKTQRGGIQNAAYSISSGKTQSIETMLHDVFKPIQSKSKKRKDLADSFSAMELNQASARATKRQRQGEMAGNRWADVED
jgi:hypothetical protein